MNDSRDAEIDDFVDLVVFAREAGLRVFNEWVKKDPVLLKKCDPDFYNLIRSLSPSDVEIINGVLPMVIGTSFYSLFESLELGTEGAAFELVMKTAQGKRVPLIDVVEDREIRNKIDMRSP